MLTTTCILRLGRVQSKLERVKEALKSIEKSIALLSEDYRPYMLEVTFTWYWRL